MNGHLTKEALEKRFISPNGNSLSTSKVIMKKIVKSRVDRI